MISIPELYSLYRDCSYKVATDSRTISGGEIFFALKGENFDGNAYAVSALLKGAAYAVVNDDYSFCPDPPSERLIKVHSPFETLQELAEYHRLQLDIPVIGLTGTNGKTTTKELIAAVLRTKFEVCATEGNLNNDIGVPLSLLKMTPSTQLAVIEMGASHPGDINKLVRISRPTHGLITNVGKAHLQGFASFEGVKAAKAELYHWLGEQEGAVLFLNQDDSVLVEMARKEPCHVFGYGLDYQGVSILPSSASDPFMSLLFPSGITLRTRLVGAYNASNVLAALAIGEYFGVSRESAFAAVEKYIPSNQRSQMQQSGSNTLIIDAYNANPSSMAVALDNLFAMEDGSKYALLGDMRELGEDSLAEHIAVVKRLAASDVRFYLVGEEFRKALIACSLPGVKFEPAIKQPKNGGKSHIDAGSIIPVNASIPPDSLFRGWFPVSGDLSLHLGVQPIEKSLILLKGSRSIEMERVLGTL
jgi:UDP-N-acetylmuramoyl-tripeptide--D-alanyl-D-alanine ligase